MRIDRKQRDGRFVPFLELHVAPDEYHRDIGAQIIYQNLRSRWNYGATVQHVPYLTGYLSYADVGNATWGDLLLRDEDVTFGGRWPVHRGCGRPTRGWRGGALLLRRSCALRPRARANRRGHAHAHCALPR